jgi:FKBP-type peptidyl-prolyl cis-trans isomerase FkpA
MRSRIKFLILSNIVFLILAVFVLDKYTYNKTSTGLRYKGIRYGMTVIEPKEGQLIVVDLVCKTGTSKKDKEILNTRQSMPLIMPYTDKLKNAKDGGFNEAVGLLTYKDRILFKIPASKAFEDNFDAMAEQYQLKKDTILFFDLELTKILDPEEYPQWIGQKMIELYVLNSEEGKNMLKQELEQIDNHINDNSEYKSANIQKTELGSRYIVEDEGTGLYATEDKIVTVQYTGMTINGKVFDTSSEKIARQIDKYNPDRKYEPFKFKVGRGQVIKGWDELMPLLRQGAKVKIFIPSVLAYGNRAVNEDIPANSILIFDIEVLKVES